MRPVTPLGILAVRLDAVSRRLADGEVDAGIRDEVRELATLAGGLDTYVEEHTTPESLALRELARATRAADWDAVNGAPAADVPPVEQEMLSGHVEGQFLAMLVHATRARRVLDIGMFTGYSALAMAEALPADGTLVACEINAEVAAFAQRCFEASVAGGRIDVRVGPALATVRGLAAGERFDLVFVDADKAGYLDYVDAVLEGGLLAPHGLLCVDNTLMQGQPWLHAAGTPNGDAIAAFNKAVSADPRVEQVLVPLRDGITLIRRVADNGETASTP